MQDLLLDRFEQLVGARTGWHIRHRDREAFRKTLDARIRARAGAGADDYYRLLESEGPEAASEWSHLIAVLTNRESYFFRDQGQISLLERRILPELVERARPRRALRVWSAGCSTGEEAYSLAILIHELLPRREEWKVLVLGTDINEVVLEHARRAVYTPWSFRMMDAARQRRYFRKQGDGFHLHPDIRGMVRFRRLNLVEDAFPSVGTETYHMDLIICRNVFIYFRRPAVPGVIRKFARALVDQGYLLTGHAELHDQQLEGFVARPLPESLIYQRAAAPAAGGAGERESGGEGERGRGRVGERESGGTGAPVTAPSLPLPRSSLLPLPQRAAAPVARAAPGGPAPRLRSRVPVAGGPLSEETEAAFRRGDMRAALAHLAPLLERDPGHYPSLCLAAKAHANLAEHQRAQECCERAIAVNALGALPYQLLACIAEERGDLEAARTALKKVLYLSPASPTAYLDLADLYAREGEGERARKMRESALALLRALPADEQMEAYGGLAAGELARQVERLVAGNA